MYFPVVSVPVPFRQFVEELNFYLHKPEVKNLSRYCTGLCTMVNKTAAGICSMLLNSPVSSSLSNFMSNGKWDANIVNRERLKIVRDRYRDSSRRHGTLVIDDFISEKTGKNIALCSRHFDHTDGKYKWGHLYVSSLLSHRDGMTPVDLKIYVREKDCASYDWEFKTKNELFRRTIDEAVKSGLPFDCVVFDAWYTNKENCDYVSKEKELNCVFPIKSNWLVRWNGEDMPISDWYRVYGKACRHKVVEINPYHDSPKKFYVTVANIYVCSLRRKVKLVVSHEGETIGKDPTFLATYRFDWDARFILTHYDYRWSIEPMHRDFKQHLGLGGCEMRTKEAVLHHAAAVLLSATLLDEVIEESGVMRWAQRQRSTGIGRKQRFLLHNLIKEFILWILGFVNADQRKAEEIFNTLKQQLHNPEFENQMKLICSKKTETKHPKQ